MKKLSAVDALGPAFRRVREVMATPFRLPFFLKIALVAALTQPSFYSMMISYPLQGVQFAATGAMGHHRSAFPVQEQFLASGMGAAGGFVLLFFAIFAIVGIAFWVLSTYLFCRLRFTVFDLVIYRGGRVREAWRKYGSQAWRYFGVMVLVSLVFLILAAATAGPFFIHMFQAMKNLGAQGPNANPLPMMAQMFPLIGVFLLLSLLWMVVDTVLSDFLLPPIAVENASIEGAFSRFLTAFRAEPGGFLVYLLLRFVVAIGLSWVLLFAVVIVLGILALVGVLVGVALYHALWQGGTGMRAIFMVVVGLITLVVLAIYMLAMISIYGITAVFKQSYAAFFFGSRYQALGDVLEPPAAEVVSVVTPAFEPPAGFPPPPPVW